MPLLNDLATQAQGKVININNVTSLVKANLMLDHTLRYLAQEQRYTTDGLLRTSGSPRVMRAIRVKLNSNLIDATPFADATTDHDVVGLCQAAIREAKGDNNEAKKIMRDFLDAEPVQDPQKRITALETIEKLIQIKAYNEARILHQMLYLGYKISERAIENRMTIHNCAMLLPNNLNNLAGLEDESALDNYNAQGKRAANFESALMDAGAQKLDQPFAEVYQNIEQILLNEYLACAKKKGFFQRIKDFIKTLWNKLFVKQEITPTVMPAKEKRDIADLALRLPLPLPLLSRSLAADTDEEASIDASLCVDKRRMRP